MNIKTNKKYLIISLFFLIILISVQPKVKAKNIVLRTYYANINTTIKVEANTGSAYNNKIYNGSFKEIKSSGWKYDSSTKKVTIPNSTTKAKVNSFYYIKSYAGINTEWFRVKILPKYELKVGTSVAPTIENGDVKDITVLLGGKKVNLNTLNASYPTTYQEIQNIKNSAKDGTEYYTSNYSFTSNNTNVAKIDTGTNGVVKVRAVGEGTATITMARTFTNIRYYNKTGNQSVSTVYATMNVTVVKKSLGNMGIVNIKEKSLGGSTYLKSNGTWCLNFNGYDGIKVKSNGTNYPNGAVALYTIQGIRGCSPNSNYLNASSNKNATYFVKGASSGNGTNFQIIGYKWDPNYATYQEFLQGIYNQIVSGYPVAIHVYNSSNKDIYVVGYAVNSTKNRTSGKISAKDIYVIDTAEGKWKKLSDFKEYKYNGKYVLGTYNNVASNSSTNAKIDQMISMARQTNGKTLAQCKLFFKNNAMKYDANYNGHWCAWFVSAFYRTYGYGSEIDYVPDYMTSQRYHSVSSAYTPKKGDLVIMGNGEHIGMIISTNPLKMIAGNEGWSSGVTSYTNSYVQERTPTNISGYYSVY